MLPCVSCRAPGRPAGVLASVFAVLSLGACDKVPLLVPTASLITIVTSRSVLPIDGTDPPPRVEPVLMRELGS